MKVYFAIPMLTGSLKDLCHKSLIATYAVLQHMGIEHEEISISDCPYLPTARNTLVAMFLADPEATDLFFIDSDVGFPAEAAIRILQREEAIVAGVYPLKRLLGGWPAELCMQDGIPLGRDGLIEAKLMPTGFMRIKRSVFGLVQEKYPQLQYADSVVAVSGYDIKDAWDYFNMGIEQGKKRWRTEDFAFCGRWRDIGGQLWVYPDIDFQHVGSHAFKGNLHHHFLCQPGGALEKAMQIDGWMKPAELDWLRIQASQHNHILEIGSYLGRSTRVLGDNTPGKVIAVDDWYGPRDVNLTDRARIYDTFHANLKDLIESGKVVPFRTDLNHFQWNGHGTPDMIFIDGDHAYESVARDIRTMLPLLANGGLLCGHDYNWPSVAQAVKELVPSARQVPNTAIWYCDYKEAPDVSESVL
jgi:predicted O-methyltransferase YrrM